MGTTAGATAAHWEAQSGTCHPGVGIHGAFHYIKSGSASGKTMSQRCVL